MGFWDTLKKAFGFGTEVVETVEEIKEVKAKKKAAAKKKPAAKKATTKAPAKKTTKKAAAKKAVKEVAQEVAIDTFLSEAKDFRSTLEKNKSRYLGRLISAYAKASDQEEILIAKEKVEAYIAKNK